ncbi:MAG: hypothetical protein M3430_14490, partial [Acidobacteriota bacterium]|nr:hypothetical protein [Acidobacteriota bacterium]
MMHRRKFLTASAGGAGLLAGLQPGASGQSNSRSRAPSKSDDLRLAGMSLAELRDRYRRDLFVDFLPFMEKHVIDHEYGGFMCNTDHLGNNVNRNKSSWFEGRGTWVYSFLYNNLAREAKYLNVARKSVGFIMKIKPGGDELWPKGLTRAGQSLTPADGEVYGDLFIA